MAIHPAGNLPRPALLCALLALAGHAAVLGLRPVPGGSTTPRTAPQLLHVNLVKPGPVARPPAAAQAAPADEPPSAQRQAPASTAHDELPDGPALPPVLASSLPDVGLPDALLPEGGVELHVFASVDANGQPVEVATAAWPASAPKAYSDMAGIAVRLLQFQPGDDERSYCLQLDFKPGLNEPTWSWRPDGSRLAARCLGGKSSRPAQPLQAP